jgi:ATP-dependent Clp protease adaptor protein ClpS
MADSKHFAGEQTQSRTDQKPRELPRYNVVLLDDDQHSYEYVIDMLESIFAHPEQKAFRMAQTVDQTGRVVVCTTHKERAELKRDQILSYGCDFRIASCVGSMTAVIEPVSGD